jgi:hypothetical protein
MNNHKKYVPVQFSDHEALKHESAKAELNHYRDNNIHFLISTLTMQRPN